MRDVARAGGAGTALGGRDGAGWRGGAGTAGWRWGVADLPVAALSIAARPGAAPRHGGCGGRACEPG